ncbi:MAG TPA: TlpA family protein disulfide reductase [Candidatus Corynebacterium avicola]|uniref:TlpA family protein disulfide reductase n=1 Tax=Candidatus Corynebacterium avicola TaxID=2838527 RepID=A0A9D1ULL2_9CORY|nr:TlpA family protein disulfide reductase [Candidatus Corynebacterium avicola]
MAATRRQQGRQHGRRTASRVTRTAVATVASAALVLGVSACSEENTAGTDAGGGGGETFEFVSPGGQTEITYDEADREKVGELSGDSLMEPGTEISLDDYEGEVVVLNALGQWCGPCRSESDDLQAVQEKLEENGSGTVLGINVRDSVADKARDFKTDNGLTYPSIYDPPFMSAMALGGLPASVIPTTIVLDKEHRPAKVFLREIDENDLWDAVEPLL